MCERQSSKQKEKETEGFMGRTNIPKKRLTIQGKGKVSEASKPKLKKRRKPKKEIDENTSKGGISGKRLSMTSGLKTPTFAKTDGSQVVAKNQNITGKPGEPHTVKLDANQRRNQKKGKSENSNDIHIIDSVNQSSKHAQDVNVSVKEQGSLKAESRINTINSKRPKPVKSTSENSRECLKKVVTNVKRPKENVSSNWQAFLASGFADKVNISNKITKKPVSKTNREIRNPKSSYTSSQASHSGLQSSSTTVTRGIECLDDAYITELDPKSEKEKHELTRCLAVDCEMVGVFDGNESVLARVSIVNQHGECVYDQFVKPKEEVSDYRTKVSGIRPSDLKNGTDFDVVQKKVASILSGKILVGHDLRYDLKVLMLKHPPAMIRDTSRYKPFRDVTKGRTPSLKILAEKILGVTIQTGEHSSVEDARATMQLYNLYQKEWEEHRLKKKNLRRKKSIAAAVGHSPTGISPKARRNRRDPHEKWEEMTSPKRCLLEEHGAYLWAKNN